MFNHQRLTELIDRSGLSLTSLGRAIGVAHSTISLLARGKSSHPHPETINSLAKYFGVLPEELFLSSEIDDNLLHGNEYQNGTLKQTLYYLMQRSGVVNSSQLHRYTGIAVPTIDRIINGETESPSLNTLTEIANFFGITIAQLKGLDPIEKGKIFNVHANASFNIPLLNISNVEAWLESGKKDLIIKYLKTDLRNLGKDSYALIHKVSDKMIITYIIDPDIASQIGDKMVVKVQDETIIVEHFKESVYINMKHEPVPISTESEIFGVVVQELRQRLYIK